jgi:SAM-dependent methyltransferase
MIDSQGYIETAAIEDNTLSIKGWSAAYDGLIDAFKLTCAGQELSALDVTKGLPRPDVNDHFPNLYEPDQCGFEIKVSLNPDQQKRARNSIIACTPLVGNQAARTLIYLIEPLIPAPELQYMDFVGGGDAFTASCDFLGYMIQFAGLKPNFHVLDVGCGFGRMACSLAHFLSPVGRYEGFDIVDRLIAWAQQSITARFPNLRFQKVEIYNKYYNREGTLRAAEFPFPYQNAAFDLVLLTSVFTHLFAPEVRHYLDEIARVLRPDGCCLCTFFLMSEESQRQAHPLEEGFTWNLEEPEESIGFDEELVLQWANGRGLALESKYYGSWSGRSRRNSYQDILVFRKRR